MSSQQCPNCGADLPPELGQHALTPTSGLVECPTCGENVTLERPATTHGATAGDDQFAGHETVEGVMEEIREKEDQA
jgi:hypothetical protein